MNTTQDYILDGQVALIQPATGYRVAIDPVFLAAAVPAKPKDLVLELGCGVGAVFLCLAHRVEGVKIDAVDCQPLLVELAHKNAQSNGIVDRVRVFEGDILAPPPELLGDHYDHVFANPPYMGEDRGHAPQHPSKRTAHVESESQLTDWVNAALKFCKPKGTVTFIYRADRLADVLAAIKEKAGEIVVFPLWSKAGQDARRVIVQARKGIKTPLRMAPGLVLHRGDGSYCQEADAVLKGASLFEKGASLFEKGASLL